MTATTRSEDLAYCLFGLFDVNMPLIYGEGNNAFRRLQEDIIRRSNDSTIFAWEPSADPPWNHGLFAASPREFAVYRDKFPNLTRMESLDLGLRGVRPEYALTNSGLRLHASLEVALHPDPYYISQGRGESYLLKVGSVSTSPQPCDTILAITLLKIGAGLFLRRDRSLEAIAHENGVPLHLGTTVTDPHVITIVLSDNYSTRLTMIRNLERSVKISLEGPDVNYLSHAIPENLWDRTTQAFFCRPSTSHVSMALVRSSLHVTLLVIIDRRGGILPLLVDWDTNWRAWNAWLFQERHVRELPTWYDLGYHVGESIESLSNSVTLEPPPDDPDRSPIKATATLQQRDISLHDLQDLSSWTQLPQAWLPVTSWSLKLHEKMGMTRPSRKLLSTGDVRVD